MISHPEETPERPLHEHFMRLALEQAQQAFAEDEPGISRTFKVAVGAIGVAVVGIIGLLIVYAVTNDSGLSSGAKTSTAAVETNEAVIVAYEQTRAALDDMATATQYAIATSVAEVTATHIGQMTLEAQMTLDAAATKTAQAHASATASAIAATQDAIATSAQQTADASNRLSGQIVVEGNTRPKRLAQICGRGHGLARSAISYQLSAISFQLPAICVHRSS